MKERWSTQPEERLVTKVIGAIRDNWLAQDAEAGFGAPLDDEWSTVDGVGGAGVGHPGASISWTTVTGAHEVHGATRATWAAMT